MVSSKWPIRGIMNEQRLRKCASAVNQALRCDQPLYDCDR